MNHELEHIFDGQKLQKNDKLAIVMSLLKGRTLENLQGIMQRHENGSYECVMNELAKSVFQKRQLLMQKGTYGMRHRRIGKLWHVKQLWWCIR